MKTRFVSLWTAGEELPGCRHPAGERKADHSRLTGSIARSAGVLRRYATVIVTGDETVDLSALLEETLRLGVGA
jgi:hypothetical protein